MSHLQVFCFSHIASSNFLLRLPVGSCQLSDDGRSLEVQATVHSVVDGLQHALPKLLAAMKQIKARRRKGRAATEDVVSDGGDADPEGTGVLASRWAVISPFGHGRP